MTEPAPDAPLGTPFPLEERRATDVLGELGRMVVAVNDPPWSAIASDLPEPVSVVVAGDMELATLDHHADATADDGAEVVVGVGGGTALDTAKYLAWRRGLPLVQVPTITSVDAGFTDAVGVRDEGHVRYVGSIVPQVVLLDVDLVRSAPARLNRAGVGDVLSCHTALHDWRAAADAGHPPDWHEGAAALGRSLLAELEAALPDIAAVTPDGVRFLADAHRRIGAACTALGHSRFEEGSEHFVAYAHEHATGARHVHGELIAFAVVVVAHLQGNDPDRAQRIVRDAGIVAHPDDLGIGRTGFVDTVVGLRAHARAQGLDIGVADLRDLGAADAEAAYDAACELPRR